MTISRDEARKRTLPGWNIRCNLWGSYGASWLPGTRPGWGALALCPEHAEAYLAEIARHKTAIASLSQINFEQERAND